MLVIITIAFPGLEASVQETIQTTNYAKILTSAHYIAAAVERISTNDSTALDVLIAYVHSLIPYARNWPEEAEDDWLLNDHLKLLADKIKHLAQPFMPVGGRPQYSSHTDDTLTLLVKVPEAHYHPY